MAGTTKPDFLHVGALVKVQHWVGEITDLAETAEGRIMVLVASPKGIWRNHSAEWLEYQPGQIVAATPADVERDLKVYEDRIARMASDLADLRARWLERMPA